MSIRVYKQALQESLLFAKETCDISSLALHASMCVSARPHTVWVCGWRGAQAKKAELWCDEYNCFRDPWKISGQVIYVCVSVCVLNREDLRGLPMQKE